MPQLEYIEINKTLPTSSQISASVTTTVGIDDLSPLMSLLIKGFFESTPNLIEPVGIVNDTIKLKEYLMVKGKPYAFSYKGKDYMVTRKEGKTQLFELRD